MQVFINNDVTQVEGTPVSRGTAKSGLEIVSRPLLTRENGKLVKLSGFSPFTKNIDGTERTFLQITWPDVLISYISTGIPTIETFISGVGANISPTILRLAQYRWGRTILSWMIDRLPKGPEEKAQTERQGLILSIVTNDAGDKAAAALTTPETYLFTFHSALLVAKQVVNGKWQPGFQAVGKVYGPDLVLQIPGVSRKDLPSSQE